MAWDDTLVAHVSKYTAATHNEIINQIKARVLHALSTAENDVLVGAPGGGTWVKKTLAEFKTILGLGSAAYTTSTAYTAASHASDTANPHGVTAAQAGALPSAGGTVSGSVTVTGDITCNGTIQGVKPDLNTVTSNLGNPTVEEMALCPGQFTNKLRFVSADLQEESTDGVNWTTSTRLTADQLADFMIGEGQAYLTQIIPVMQEGESGYYRLTWEAAAYNYLNTLYMYLSTAGNNLDIKIEQFYDGGWHEVLTGQVCNWPGHVYIPHSVILFRPSPTSFGASKVRITFSVSSALQNGEGIDLGAIEWFGGYPAGQRNVESYDKDKNVTFPAGITAGGVISPQQAATASAPTYAKGAIYFDTTLNKLMIGGASGWETVDST